MHLLIELTEDWLVNNGMYGTNWNMPSLYKWESEVLLPWLKEQEDAWKKASLINLTNGQELWGIVKRREQAEWLKKQKWSSYDTIGTLIGESIINQAFGLTEEKQESCEEMIKKTHGFEDCMIILAQRIDKLENPK